MKYIVLSRDLGSGRKQELPFAFPEDVSHTDMVATLSPLLRGAGDVHVVAAGELMFVAEPRCLGRSTSLGRDSRGRLDAKLLQFHDYQHGFVEDEGGI